MFAEAGQVHHEGGGLKHARAQGVGNGDVAGVDGLHEAGDAEVGVGAEFELVAEVIILAAEDDIDGFEAFERFEEDAVVADGEVAALDEGVAEIAGEVGVLEVGFVVGAGGEQDDAGVVAVVGGEGFEGVAQGAEEGGKAADAAVTEDIGEGAGDDDAVFEGVAGAGGCLGAVADDPEGAVGGASDVGGVEVEPAVVGDVGSVEWAEEAAMGEDEFGGEESVVDQALGAVEVGDDGVEEAGALGEGAFDPVPFGSAEDEGDGVEVPGAVHAGGVAVDVVGDAVVVDELFGGLPAALELCGAKVVEEVDEHLPVGADGAVAFFHFVEDGSGGDVGFAEAVGYAAGGRRREGWLCRKRPCHPEQRLGS